MNERIDDYGRHEAAGTTEKERLYGVGATARAGHSLSGGDGEDGSFGEGSHIQSRGSDSWLTEGFARSVSSKRVEAKRGLRVYRT